MFGVLVLVALGYGLRAVYEEGLLAGGRAAVVGLLAAYLLNLVFLKLYVVRGFSPLGVGLTHGEVRFALDDVIGSPRWQEENRRLTAGIGASVSDAPPATVLDVGETPEVQPVAWTQFQGKANTPAVLEEKAKAFAGLLVAELDTPCQLAATMKTVNPQIGWDDETERHAEAEASALLLSLVRQNVAQALPSPSYDTFMAALETEITQALTSKGMAPDAWHTLLAMRYAEYPPMKWMPDSEKDSLKGTRLWEFAKKEAELLKVGQSFMYNTLLTNRILEAVLTWNLMTLLPE